MRDEMLAEFVAAAKSPFRAETVYEENTGGGFMSLVYPTGEDVVVVATDYPTTFYVGRYPRVVWEGEDLTRDVADYEVDLIVARSLTEGIAAWEKLTGVEF